MLYEEAVVKDKDLTLQDIKAWAVKRIINDYDEILKFTFTVLTDDRADVINMMMEDIEKMESFLNVLDIYESYKEKEV